MTVGQTIRALRKKKGLTQEELGRQCGLTGAMLSGYERGGTFPKKKTLDALAEALDVPVSRLTGQGVPTTAPAGWNESSALLLNGMLGVLKARYGRVEKKSIGDGGDTAVYYLIGLPPESFILREEDLRALVSAAKSSIVPLTEGLRARQENPGVLRKLG